MSARRTFLKSAGILGVASWSGNLPAQPPHTITQRTPTYRRIKLYLDSIPSIDTHEHLRAFDQLPGYVETDRGRGMNLYGIWHGSYVNGVASIAAWNAGEKFEAWWKRAKHDFDNVRATYFYRYIWLSFRDLYNVDFDRITDRQAAELDRRIFDNYRDRKWLYHVLKKRARIELMICDRHWERFDFRADYPFEFLTFNVTTLVWGFHPSEYIEGSHGGGIRSSFDDPYLYARRRGLPMSSLDDYLALIDRMFVEAKAGDAVCLKTTLGYQRTLQFDNVAKETAARVFGRSRAEITPEDAKAFEDFIMWRLTELSARHDMPFQIHTGMARVQGSNPMLLVDLIEANPKTKFELFHGGYPWIGETAVIGNRFGKHVWINGVWLPTISYTAAKRAFSEWLEVMPSNRITWGGDDTSGEGIYGQTELSRRCWAEVLAEKIDRRELSDGDARRIGKQIQRDNALELYPRLKEKLGAYNPAIFP
ncbi:MAG: amidohydrolase [Acidobacteriota bacterium]|nr:amidohydrolase [Acidobacteriota bacterium]